MRRFFICILLISSTLFGHVEERYLIWQIPEVFWEYDWIREMFQEVPFKEIWDGSFEQVRDRAIIVVGGLNQEKLDAYLNKFKERNFTFGLIHLSDEWYSDPTHCYNSAAFVYRNYWHKNFLTSPHVRSFPLGYKNGFWGNCHNREIKEAKRRAFTWSFAGQINKSTRIAMISQMKKIPSYFIHEIQTFADPKSLAPEKYRDLLLDSLFVPCPRGGWNLDSFRVYEALECGCIPIVEKGPLDYFTKFLGEHPFLTVGSWDEAPALIENALKNPEQLEKLRNVCQEWWKTYKRNLQHEVAKTVKAHFAESAITYSIDGPGRFGDCLMNYIHAKWVSYKYDMPLLYTPFWYSNELQLSQLEPAHNTNHDRYTRVRLGQHEKLDEFMQKNRGKSVLFHIPYFPESSWEREHYSAANHWPYFPIDPKDSGFKAELRKCIAPIQTLSPLHLPKDRISVAVHVRLGTGYDNEESLKNTPTKFPPHEFYIDGIRTIYHMLHKRPLYVYIFTDDPSPREIAQKYQSELRDCNVEFGYREKDNRHDAHVVEDFFAMAQFDCAIHGDSNYSTCASMIADYKLEITPGKPRMVGNRGVIEVLQITTGTIETVIHQ